MPNPDGAKDDEQEPFAQLPENMRTLIQHVGFPTYNMPEDSTEIFERAKNGKCMLCEQPLGENTILSVNTQGIVAGFCSGTCHTDMGVLGFLSEQLDDLNQRIDFRAGEVADAPDTDEG